ncbi:MAG TPA: 30S ribosomal protein S17 [candidate division Zixibacteria bacterium]|nr:30S ribosomal protein S17 [candidate division Zixibacteria bacterium]
MRERTRVREGFVTSDRMDKTVIVEVVELIRHPLFGKVIKRRSKLKAHDERNECNMGDRVRVIESKPFAKTVKWRVSAILERAVTAEA